VTKQRLYLETMEAILRGNSKYIIDQSGAAGSGVLPYLPLQELQRQPAAPAPAPPPRQQPQAQQGAR